MFLINVIVNKNYFLLNLVTKLLSLKKKLYQFNHTLKPCHLCFIQIVIYNLSSFIFKITHLTTLFMYLYSYDYSEIDDQKILIYRVNPQVHLFKKQINIVLILDKVPLGLIENIIVKTLIKTPIAIEITEIMIGEELQMQFS